jgi:hypothetical protein
MATVQPVSVHDTKETTVSRTKTKMWPMTSAGRRATYGCKSVGLLYKAKSLRQMRARLEHRLVLSLLVEHHMKDGCGRRQKWGEGEEKATSAVA